MRQNLRGLGTNNRRHHDSPLPCDGGCVTDIPPGTGAGLEQEVGIGTIREDFPRALKDRQRDPAIEQ